MRPFLPLFFLLFVAIETGFAQGGFSHGQLFLERYTTEQCGNCPRTEERENEMIDQLRSEGYQVMKIAHHTGYGKDWLTLPGSEQLLPYIFPTVSFAPALSINRWSPKCCNLGEDGTPCALCTKDDQPEILALNIVKYTKEDLVRHAHLIASSPSPVEIKAIRRSGEIAEDVFNYTVTLEAVDGADFGDLYLTAVIVQEKIKARNQAGIPFGTEYTHDNAVRSFVTDPLGEPISGEKKTLEFHLDNVSFKDEAITSPKMEERHLVVILHRNPKNPLVTDRVVYSWASIRYGEELANEEIARQELAAPTPYIEGGQLHFTQPVDGCRIYDLQGRLLSHNSFLSSGTYLLLYYYHGKTFEAKLLVP